jgi:hypothetical protein
MSLFKQRWSGSCTSPGSMMCMIMWSMGEKVFVEMRFFLGTFFFQL